MKLNEYGSTILFDSGKASLKQTMFHLGSITEILKNILIQILVEGHTDSDEVTK
jgi:outer membrane protein OmpA-like peptidoglycan-associated protein